MNRSLPKTERYYSREEYRRWCEEQPRGRFERVDGRIVPMAPKPVAHARAKGAVYLALRRAITSVAPSCEVLPDGATVEVGDCDYEPDALVNCGERLADDAIAAPNPVIVAEVLSPGTPSIDTSAKLIDYFAVPSIVHYLIVHPSRPMVIHHRKVSAGIETRIVLSGPIRMDPPGIVITTDDIYEER